MCIVLHHSVIPTLQTADGGQFQKCLMFTHAGRQIKPLPTDFFNNNNKVNVHLRIECFKHIEGN